MTKKPSVFGGVCIVACVCVGAGMLGLPTAGAGAWMMWSTLALLATMLIMTLSGWMLLEALKHYDHRASFSTVTKDLLGKKASYFNNLMAYFVGGILLYAYITSAGLMISGVVSISNEVAAVIFVAIFSSFVLYSTKAVDKISVVLILFMVLSFVFGVFGLTFNVKPFNIFSNLSQEFRYFPYVLAMFPAALTSFGYHHTVASLRSYYKSEALAKKAILGGTLIALCLYLVWIFSVYGNLPRYQFGAVIAKGGNVDVLLASLGGAIESERVANVISIFSAAAIFSSFVGVGLGVFDFLADLCGFENNRKGRMKTWILTFFPPLVLSLFFPFGFLIAIGYAGAAATVWTCIVPALLARKSRSLPKRESDFVAPGGNKMIYLVVFYVAAVAVIHFMGVLDLLPSPGL
ncbi:aromatic amino acid transporter [Halomonas sp. SpR8]|uniref:aromatic amino acid transporter n=1 Tax=Halomonas sp. SpR8 TaxID=3050463 RepID=UPI0027E448DA|nr:aromatic amino acid transporter [Halomonas sp. SpR8]MDQ7729453.1 aromatic amino acid transporter [Halomonas sp. SpR8]